MAEAYQEVEKRINKACNSIKGQKKLNFACLARDFNVPARQEKKQADKQAEQEL
ncbi:hypothetical protein EYZ11_006230 [Aspergillus tanneri]|uniref:Uncharacterized protein n=1 Tax=Aspergillus tanneri TaxID=1220188 RepID=A0A4V3UP97_9EURO|nr:uncharacterized protein ATNIH1004_010698 [Aspergillus tanneri]KAA8641759.1 hypothetical protein ATNIH1004_010698 [Aspergillus tanneri]THC94294.1 hypothetical protein EYZ11_006230 [Aspergillus tanneri]